MVDTKGPGQAVQGAADPPHSPAACSGRHRASCQERARGVETCQAVAPLETEQLKGPAQAMVVEWCSRAEGDRRFVVVSSSRRAASGRVVGARGDDLRCVGYLRRRRWDDASAVTGPCKTPRELTDTEPQVPWVPCSAPGLGRDPAPGRPAPEALGRGPFFDQARGLPGAALGLCRPR